MVASIAMYPNNSVKNSFIYTQLNVKTILLQTIPFSISIVFSSIWPIDRTLSGATNPGQSGSGSYGNEGVLRIPKISSITGASPSDSLVSYPGHSLGESYLSAEMQSVYSTAPAGCAIKFSESNYLWSILYNENFFELSVHTTGKKKDYQLWKKHTDVLQLRNVPNYLRLPTQFPIFIYCCPVGFIINEETASTSHVYLSQVS